MVTAYQLNVDVVELLAPADVVKNSVQIQLGLLFNIKASQQYFHRLLVRALRVETHLMRGWRAAASAAAHKDAVVANLLNLHGIEMRDDVWVVVCRRRNLVQ